MRSWRARSKPPSLILRLSDCKVPGPMRFTFYGRVSTEDQQGTQSSRNWQLSRSRQLIEPAGGEIVVEYFDIGQSRSLPWSRRPQASELLNALGDSGRGLRW